MSFLYAPRPFDEESRRVAIVGILDGAIPDRDFYLLVAGAILFALLAIFTDSIPVLIASMIVAPLASPILALGLGITVGDMRLALRSLGMLIASLLAAIVLAWLGTLLFGYIRVDPVFISFGGNLYIATIIALVAGAIAAYGFVRVKVGAAMTGIGIAVSLMPPLVATGVGIADANWTFAVTTFTIFVLNVAGILAASAIVFSAFGLRKEYRATKHRLDASERNVK
ncbi:MAG TPA: TIGR00341 family protein [Candidatus Paceibacterota bacterium]|jgi:uncharacterized hydrophobic protein (TIGR00341 family)|nr:TIGR00341 family protein [Candidatus Paceibacterota bacterium]